MFASKREKAINSLKNQQEKLIEPNNRNQAWTSYTADLVRKFIGPESEMYKHISEFTFEVYYLSGHTTEGKFNEAQKIIINAIEFIEQHGLYKKPKVSVTAVIKANWLVALFVVVSPAIFTFGGWWKYTFTYKEQIQNLQKENEFLKDTIRVLRDTSGK